jgi:hypothetical protein
VDACVLHVAVEREVARRLQAKRRVDLCGHAGNGREIFIVRVSVSRRLLPAASLLPARHSIRATIVAESLSAWSFSRAMTSIRGCSPVLALAAALPPNAQRLEVPRSDLILLPADEYAAVVRLDADGFSFLVESGVCEPAPGFVVDRQIRHQLAVAVNESRDELAIAGDAHVLAGQVITVGLEHLPFGGSERGDEGDQQRPGEAAQGAVGQS